MARDPQDRYQDANELRKEISDWQDGILRRGKALELVYEAENLIPQATTMIAKASSLREDAKEYLQSKKMNKQPNVINKALKKHNYLYKSILKQPKSS